MDRKQYYFSSKIKKQFAEISRYPLTIIEAPSGFGKTTGTKMDVHIAEEVLNKRNTYIGKAEILGVPYAAAYQTILDPNGDVIGALFTGVPVAEINGISRQAVFTPRWCWSLH